MKAVSAFVVPSLDGFVSMSDDEYRQIRDFIHSYCGIYFDADSKYLLEKRLARQLSVHQIPSFQDYLFFLKYDTKREEELDTIVDLLTTNETYFFREEYQLRAFSEEIIPEIQARPEKKRDSVIRVWSAGCSTGEEPYTIAMILKESPRMADWRVDIIATDISQRVLQVARKGIYSRISFRTTDERFTRKYFEHLPGAKYRIKDDLRSMVTFAHLNLMDALKITLLERMDVIFCRNVLIYFDPQAKRTVIQSLYDRLESGGYLLLGHAESLMNVTTLFRLTHLKNDLVYQKPTTPFPADAYSSPRTTGHSGDVP